MTVGLKVNTNVILGRSFVMEMLHTGGSNRHGETKGLFDKGGRGTVGVGGLDNSDLEVTKTSGFGKVGEEGSSQRGNLVSVEKVESAVLGGKVVDDTIGITIQGSVTAERDRLQSRRNLLIGLDKVGSALSVASASGFSASIKCFYLVVKLCGRVNIIIDDVEV